MFVRAFSLILFVVVVVVVGVCISWCCISRTFANTQPHNLCPEHNVPIKLFKKTTTKAT